jgi:hypothetical protein
MGKNETLIILISVAFRIAEPDHSVTLLLVIRTPKLFPRN